MTFLAACLYELAVVLVVVIASFNIICEYFLEVVDFDKSAVSDRV